MANIAIYTGSTFFTTGSTPFGFYDADSTFRTDADKVVKWCAQRLGYPIENIELQDIQFYAAFEEAVTIYGNEVYQWKIRENYISMEGSSTGSALNNQVITPNLASTIRIASTYGSEAGSGGTTTYYTASIPVTAGNQNYNLNTWAAQSASLQPGDSIEVKTVFQQTPPAIVRYFDPYAGTGTGIQSLLETFNFGSYSPGINFMLMPLNFDMLKLQAIELNDQVRKSAYSFDLINNQLRLFPIPVADTTLLFHYIKKSERNQAFISGSANNLITNISNVPYNNPVYSQLNSVGKMWIFQYTLALVKEMLAYVRGKYGTIPIPGSEVTLNQADLIADARSEKAALLEQLRTTLEDSSRTKQLEKRSMDEGFVNQTLQQVPLPFYIF
jgi:hypothetical protein